MVDFVASTVLSAAALDSAFNQVEINAQTGTSYPLILSDQGKLVTLNNASAIALTVPLNNTVAFPTGTQIGLLALGTGQVTVAGASGVTVNATPGLKIRTRYSMAVLIKIDTNSWVLAGDVST